MSYNSVLYLTNIQLTRLPFSMRFYSSFLLLSLLLVTSCISDVDFDQSTDVIIEPVTEVSLVFTDVEASRFVDNGAELQSVTDAVDNIEIFTNEVVVDYLVRADLFFEVTNQIDRAFEVNTIFLDDNDQLLRASQFSIDPQSSITSQPLLFTIEFDENNINSLIETKTIRFQFQLLPSTDGSTLTENDTETISLDSKGVFYFRAETTE